MQFRKKKRPATEPDITPLIDVVFLLLIFFMLSTTFVSQTGIKIELPKSSAENIKKEKEEIRVDISKKGDVYFKGKKIGIKELRELFVKAAGESKESVVIIHADELSFHGKVVEIMDSAKSSGITKLAIATEPEKR